MSVGKHYCTGIAEVVGSNPVQTRIFFEEYNPSYSKVDRKIERKLNLTRVTLTKSYTKYCTLVLPKSHEQ